MLMNWVTRNVLQILDLGEYMVLPAWNWHKLRTAVAEQTVNHLAAISIRRLATRYTIRPSNPLPRLPSSSSSSYGKRLCSVNLSPPL